MESRDYIDPNKLASNTPELTPGEKTEVKLDGQNFEINTNEILFLLENTVQKYFSSIDYSFLTTIKSLLTHFYYNEKECLSKIKNYNVSKKKFCKNLIYDSINEIFNQAPEKLTKEIFSSIEKIRGILYKKEKNKEEITLDIFYKLEEEILGTKEVPKFLVQNDIKYIKFRENYQRKEKKRPELEKIIDYYKKIELGQLKPFDYIHNKSKLFDIFILSNSKDIENNDIVNEIFLENYKDILSWFNLDINIRDYEYVLNNLIKISSIEKNGLFEDLFLPLIVELNEPNNTEDLFLILLSSLFFCILNKMKEPQNKINIKEKNNNINNSRITKFFINFVNIFVVYYKDCKYNIKNLVDSLFKYIIYNSNITDKGKLSSINNNIIINSNNNINNINDNLEENIDYDFQMIEETIMQSNDNNLIERFKNVKSKLSLDPFNSNHGIIGTFLARVANVFTSNYFYYANYIRLSPFQKYISSNMVTILISGFGSENDIHSLEWRKFLENAPINSNYYFYHWPGASLTKIILKSLPIGLHGIKFDSDLPQVFLDSKKKAVICGKMLAIILKSNLFFGNRQINLVAFSLGNHVVKHCLKELSNSFDGKCIINDITFIAGATTFKNQLNWYNRFKKIIGGRIVNCYSKKDLVLKLLYSNCTGNKLPIGNHEIDINDGIGGKNIIENFDFTDLNLGHLDYRKNFNKILKRINFEK